jgi:hypothetical protein
VDLAENCVDMKLMAMLVGRYGNLGVETAITENVSSRGLGDDLGQGRFGTGLEFVESSEPLELGRLSTASESPRS